MKQYYGNHEMEVIGGTTWQLLIKDRLKVVSFSVLVMEHKTNCRRR